MDSIWVIIPTRPKKRDKKKIALTICRVLMAVILKNEFECNVALGR